MNRLGSVSRVTLLRPARFREIHIAADEAVVELEDDLASSFVNRLYQPLQSRNHCIRVDAYLAVFCAPQGVNVHVPGDDEPNLSLCKRSVSVDQSFGYGAIFCHGLESRGMDKPVLDLHVVYFGRPKKKTGAPVHGTLPDSVAQRLCEGSCKNSY